MSLAALSLPGPVSGDSNPMADRFYALEKLTAAVDALATGAGRVQERLGHAAIHLVRVRPEDMQSSTLSSTLSTVCWIAHIDMPATPSRLWEMLKGI